MKIFGFEISVRKHGLLSPLGNQGGWWPIIRESFTGAWQRNVEVRHDLVLANWAVYACMTLIASDIGKLRAKLVERTGRIWREVESPAFSPVLRKPNRYQTRQKFVEQWILSKLISGNTYVLKQRDARGVVVAMYVLDPYRVKVLIAPDGSVYYQIDANELAQTPGAITLPASEIMHDTMCCIYHPLVGISPIFASGLAATQGLKIQQNSAKFFENMSRPSGMITAPAEISEPTAKRLKESFEANFAGDQIGRLFVAGDGLKYEPMTINAVDSQMVEQLKMSAEMVCSTFHVPPHMVGVGPMPSYNNIEALNQQYYSQCLQSLIESAEALLDEGLGLASKVEGRQLGVEFDLDDLLKMDTATKIKSVSEGIKASVFAPNEGREKFNLPPVEGGDSPMIQQQNYSLAALAKRDAKDDPFGTAAPPALPAPEDDEDEEISLDDVRSMLEAIEKGITCETH